MRPIEMTDAGSVADIIRCAFGSIAGVVVPSPSALHVTAAAITAHLAEGGGGVLVPGRACLLWAGQAGALYVSRIAVLPEHRRLGLASAMLGLAEAEAKRRRLPSLRLSTRLALTGNRRLFARWGFVEGQRHAHPGYDQPTYVEMEKPLDEQAPPSREETPSPACGRGPG